MTAAEAVGALDELAELARQTVVARVCDSGRIVADRLGEAQLAAHALAWLATEARAARELERWATSTGDALDRRIADAYAGGVVAALRGGVVLGPCERVGLGELGVDDATAGARLADAIAWAERASSSVTLTSLAHDAFDIGSCGTTKVALPGTDDETLEAMRAQTRAFASRRIAPIAHELHRRDALVPLELVAEMAHLGCFALTVAPEHGGQGLGKIAMCVVTEEIARASLGVASVATRSEIACDLLSRDGTQAQRAAWLGPIARGEVLPTAVFTEPDHGSDLARVSCRAERLADGSWSVHGQKTWATHAARADLMTMLVRVVPGSTDHDGLGILLAPKQRGQLGRDFVDAGLVGAEIPVIGYRGMKEYELSFDGFHVPAGALLGDEPGRGFRQLMATFETARIQTAARAVGLAQAALDEAMRYGHERVQFGAPIASFPRVAGKLGRMIVSVMAARRLAYAAARAKDEGRRADLDAGMAKLLSARAAWECADACVQIHGGAGYAEESVASRLLLDARVLSLFEGTSEIQAQVIARRLLAG